MRTPFHSSNARGKRAARFVCIAGLSAVFAAGSTLTVPAAAYAASAQTLSELARLQAQVQDAASDYASASAKADELNAQAAGIAQEILAIEQERLPVQQKKAATAARDLYKMQASATNTIAMLLTSNSLSDFFTMTKYLTTIQNDQVSALNALNKLEDELNGKLKDMSTAKDEAEAARQDASAALAQAQNAAAEIQQKANAEDAAEAEAARQAADQAAKLAEQEAAKQQTNGSSNNGDANSGSGSNGSQTPSNEPQEPAKPQPQQPSNNNQQGNNSNSNESGWLSGKASYYGIGDGFMGGTTASGAIVTETSMGVAMLNVPLGTMVEIRYNGLSVVAVVNDRGPYAHGRVIDMQPAVARALGFLSVGVGTVQYRFL